MTRAFEALSAEPWAILPSHLHLLAAIAQRNISAPEILAAGEWQKRDFDLMAGPGADRLPGAQRAYAIDGVAILPVVGPIFPRANMMTEMSGATSVTMLQNDYRAALNNPAIGAVMLLMDTPGGATSGISAFADAVNAGSKKKTTVAYVTGMACSAGYWIGSNATEVVMDQTALVGSIGVVMGVAKQVEHDSNGYRHLEIVSSGAPNKRPDPLTEGGLAEIRATLDALETHFVSAVARGRKVSAATVKSEFGAGGLKVGQDAVAVGMADRVQSYEAALAALRQKVANQRKLESLKS